MLHRYFSYLILKSIQVYIWSTYLVIIFNLSLISIHILFILISISLPFSTLWVIFYFILFIKYLFIMLFYLVITYFSTYYLAFHCDLIILINLTFISCTQYLIKHIARPNIWTWFPPRYIWHEIWVRRILWGVKILRWHFQFEVFIFTRGRSRHSLRSIKLQSSLIKEQKTFHKPCTMDVVVGTLRLDL